MTSATDRLNLPAYSKFGNAQIELMESITVTPAVQLVEQSGILSRAEAGEELTVLDSAGGSGILTYVLKSKLKAGAKVKVVLEDVEQTMVDLAKERTAKEGWKDVEPRVVDALNLDFPDSSLDYIMINCGLQLFPEQDKPLKEVARTLKPRGVLSYSSWTVVPFFTLLSQVDSSISHPPPFSLPCSIPSSIPSYLAQYGFSANDVKIEDVKAKRTWKSAADAVKDFALGAPKLFEDEERNGKLVELLKKQQGEGEVELVWEGVAVTARKA
ncbi:hypothetical protein JCM8547_000401 [Rhodosporidiobolus lusitaniae]